MKLNDNKRAVTALVACVALGTTGGIAGSMAAKSSSTKRSTRAANAQDAPGRPFGRGHFGGPPVHSEEVVLNKAGTAFITETEDNGVVKSASGNDVTITEGTKTVTYKDVTVSIPDNATIMRNGAAAKLSDLAAGDHVHVSSSSDGTFVGAFDSSHQPPRGPGGPGHGFGDHDGHPGPPPGVPGAPNAPGPPGA